MESRTGAGFVSAMLVLNTTLCATRLSQALITSASTSSPSQCKLIVCDQQKQLWWKLLPLQSIMVYFIAKHLTYRKVSVSCLCNILSELWVMFNLQQCITLLYSNMIKTVVSLGKASTPNSNPMYFPTEHFAGSICFVESLLLTIYTRLHKTNQKKPLNSR